MNHIKSVEFWICHFVFYFDFFAVIGSSLSAIPPLPFLSIIMFAYSVECFFSLSLSSVHAFVLYCLFGDERARFPFVPFLFVNIDNLGEMLLTCKPIYAHFPPHSIWIYMLVWFYHLRNTIFRAEKNVNLSLWWLSFCHIPKSWISFIFCHIILHRMIASMGFMWWCGMRCASLSIENIEYASV